MLVHQLSAASAPIWLAVGGYGPGSGRFGANVAALVALAALTTAFLARSRFRSTPTAALLAQAMGLTAMNLAVWHVARSAAGFGTGNGRAGGIVAAAIALAALVLAARTLARPRD
ncbi:DUF6223 family protein [Nocardia sp. CA-136227]|uniref:DUF6223 family protein n=1 Tax=Nocardia sp. CA-136227 TaxID=3239979 RepID=UPI003D96BCEC